MDPAQIRTTEDVCATARRLLGDDLRMRPTVSHVTAAWAPGDGRNVVLRIGPRTPRSSTDSFVLALSRARADAILTTGRNLRAEPELKHTLDGPVAAALRAWRLDVLGRTAPARTVVLSRGEALPSRHPIFDSGRPVTVVVPRGREVALRAGFRGSGVEVMGLEELDLRAAVQWLRRERGSHLVSVESGPSTAADLYSDPLAVDELLLSRYHARTLPTGVAGGELPDDGTLERLFSGVYRQEEDADWSFARYHR